MLSGHQTRWPNDRMLVHPTCWVVQHLSFGRALSVRQKLTTETRLCGWFRVPLNPSPGCMHRNEMDVLTVHVPVTILPLGTRISVST